MIDGKSERERLKSHNKSIMEEIQALRIRQHLVPSTIFQSRCHWCGIRISDDSPDTIEEQFVGDQVQIKDLGTLPSVYEFDHEQKRLCMTCSKLPPLLSSTMYASRSTTCRNRQYANGVTLI